MAASFLADLDASTRHAQAYWRALRAAALKRLQAAAAPDVGTAWPDKRLVWPMAVYGGAPAGSTPETLLAGEDALFSADDVVRDGAAFQQLIGARAPDKCTYLGTSAAAASVAARLGDARRLIAARWPEAAAEMAALIRGVAFVETRQTFSSTSDPKLFGLIHIDASFYGERSPAELATALIHETGHHALFVASSVAKLIDRPEQILYSPLRRESRPAIGVVHAAVALYRMTMWGRRLQSGDRAEAGEAAEAARIARDLVPKLDATMQELAAITVLEGGQPLLRDLERRNG